MTQSRALAFYSLVLWGLIFLVLPGCREDFCDKTPFPEIADGDTVFFDANNWFVLAADPLQKADKPGWPYAFHLLGVFNQGHIFNACDKLYFSSLEVPDESPALLLDPKARSGDTLHKFSPYAYILLLDQEKNEEGDRISYILRRNLIGVERLRERTIWALSQKHGVLAVANYDIGMIDGDISMNIAGDPEFFMTDRLKEKILRHDHNEVLFLEREKGLLFEFNKIKGLLTSRDIRKGEALARYEIRPSKTRKMKNFSLYRVADTLRLRLEGDCYDFDEGLNLLRKSPCPPQRGME